MKRVIAITIALTVVSPLVAFAQVSSTVPLADVARKEIERRKTARKATKVFTNGNLGANEVDLPPRSMPSFASPSNATPSNTSPGSPTIPGGKVEPAKTAGGKDQAFWQGRIKTAMDDLQRTQMFADSLQTKINSLRTDFVNRDNRVEREKIQQDLNTSLAELERLNKEVDQKRKAIAAIEDEARKAGVPPGWLRPGN
ncbi:MAG TPA: hypothetical protein VJ691_02500 [Vicinamibacterales bacterium]|nr:hypothetical protein [Vicinamibacterales bacterium]